MDNISHSLVGLTFAESVYQCYEKKTGEPKPLFRTSLWFLSFVANNAPDIDYLYIIILKLKRLGGLLHHRGHTHTILFGFPQALVLLLLVYLVSKHKKWIWSKGQWWLFAVVSFLGVWIHIGLDALNSYGTHPFWPFLKNWYYIDTVFIVEPLFWVGFTPLLFSASKNVLLRTAFSTLFFAILVLCWISGLVLPELAAVVTLAGLLMAMLAVLALRSQKSRYIHAVTWFSCLLFLTVFHQISQNAKAFVRSTMEAKSPGVVVHDIIMSPLPANPFCWGTLVVESFGPVSSYTIRRAIVTPFPKIVGLERCLKIELASRYIKLGKTVSIEEKLHWFGFEEFSIVRFRELARKHCGFAGWLRFTRAPAFVEEDGKLTVRDMRYDLRQPNFTQIEFPSAMPMQEGCHLGVDWDPPRSDLLAVE